MSQGHSTEDADIPRSSLQWDSCSVGGASRPWSQSPVEPRAQSADWPDPLGSSHPCISLGSWGLAFHTQRWVEPIESDPSTAGPSRTLSLGALEGHRGYSASSLFCSSSRHIALSCHRKCPCLYDSLLSLPLGGVLPASVGPRWSLPSVAVLPCEQMPPALPGPSSVSQLHRVYHRSCLPTSRLVPETTQACQITLGLLNEHVTRALSNRAPLFEEC